MMNINKLRIVIRSTVIIYILLCCINTEIVLASDRESVQDDTKLSIDNCIDNVSDVIDYSEIDRLLKDVSITKKISFEDEVNRAVKEGSMDYKDYIPNFKQVIKDELVGNKDVIIKIIVITIITAIFANFSNVFGNTYVSGTSFIIVYMLLITMLLNSFTKVYKIGYTTVKVIKSFMEVVFPVYSVASFMSNGIKTSTVYTQLTVVILTVIEVVFLRIMLPLINIYLIVNLVNNINISSDSNSVIVLNRLADFIKMIINQSLKLAIIFITSIGTIQRLIAPSADKMAKGVISNGIKLVPFVGKGTEVVQDTVAGATIMIRNAIGGVSMAVIIIICMMPLISVGVYIIIFEIISIIVESIADKRVNAALRGISESSKLIIRLIGVSGLLFIISIALICV